MRYLFGILMAALIVVSPGTAMAKGDTLVIANFADAKNMDPQTLTDSASQQVNRQIYESLVSVNAKGEIVPQLAESWTLAEDGKTYIFTLKKGVKFHNGEIMTADDVVFTFKRAKSNMGAGTRALSLAVDPESIKKIDDHTVAIGAFTPMGPVFLMAFNHPWASVLNKKAVEQYGKDYGMNPVGTGRFKFASWDKGDKLTLERWDGYHGKPATLKRIVIRAVIENASRTIELESGAVDMAMELSEIDIPRLQDNKNLKLYTFPGPNVYFLCFDVTSKPYDDWRVREAMNIVVDRPGILKAVFKGHGEVATGPISSAIKYSTTKLLENPPRDIAKARKMLAEAGYPDGFKGAIMTPDRRTHMDMSTVLQANFKEIGLDMEIKVSEWGAFLDGIRHQGHAPYVSGWWQGSPAFDPYFYLGPQFHSSVIGQSNRTFMNDATVDELLDKGATLQDGPEREAVYHAVQKRINEVRPWIPMITPVSIYATAKNLKGFEPIPSLQIDLTQCYFE